MKKARKLLLIIIPIIVILLVGAVAVVLFTREQPSGHQHDFSEWEIVSEATCDQAGISKRVCACGETEERTLDPLGHHYVGAEEWLENENQYVSTRCDVCGNRSEIIYNGLYLDEAGEMYLWNCPATFSFDVSCTEGEEYVRQHVWVMDSFLSSLNPAQYEEICETLTVESLGNDTYRISPSTAYEEAMQYTAILGDKVTFCHMIGSSVTFRTAGEAKQVVEYNQDVLFLKDLEEKTPGYYPYVLTYDSATQLHTLSLSAKGILSDDFIGRVVCIGDCKNADEISTTDGEIVFGKIESITEVGDNVILTLSNPALNEVYDKINVSAGTLDSIVVAATSEAFQEELLYQVANSEGFAEAMTAARLHASSYAASNGMKAKDSPFDMDNFKITAEGTASDKDDKSPWASVNFKIVYEHEISIEKGEYKGSVTFEIVFDVKATYVVQAADTNFQVKEGKHWWNGTYLNINIELVQTWEAELDIQVKLDLHETDSQMDYIITKSGKIHRYSCMTCEKLRQDRNNLVTLEYVKSIPNYEDYECKICKPFTLTDTQFVLNLDSNILHCGNCVDAQRITKAEVIVYELYPIGGTFKNCAKCQPQNNSGLDNYIKNSLESSEWSVALDKVKESIKDELKAKDAGKTGVDKSKPVATVNVFYVFDLNFYLQPKFDFDLEASLQFNYKLKTRDVYIIRSQIDKNDKYTIVGYFDDGSKQKLNESGWEFDLQGKATARIGMMAEMTFGFVGIKDAYIGLYAETGLYAHLNGVLHLDSKGENYYGANLKAGIYFDARVTYSLFDLIEPGSIRLLKDNDYLEVPLFESGDSKAYYGFTYDGAEVVIENGLRGKLQEKFLQAAYYDLETMKKGSDTLSWFGDDDYSFTYRFEDAEGNKLTYLGVVDDEVLIYDGAPHNFTAYLYVKVVDEISPRNLLTYLGTYNKDGCSFMMDELCIVIKHSRDLEPAVLKTEASKPTDSSGQYLTGEEITFTVITNLESGMGVAIYCDGGELVRCNFSAAKKYDAEKKEITYELSAIMSKAGTHEIVVYALDKNNNPIKTKHSSATVTITVQDRNLCMPPKITTAKDQTIQVGTNLKLTWMASPYPTEGITYSVVVDYRGSDPWEYPLSGVSVEGTSYTIDGSVFSKPGRYGITVYPVSSNPSIKVPEGCYSVIGVEVVVETIEPDEGSVGLAYELNSDGTGYVVTGIGTCTDTEIVIPSKHKGLPVTAIGNKAFYDCTSLTHVVIADGIKKIETYAFEKCRNLMNVVFPESLTVIEDGAFRSCSRLNSIELSDNVKTIGVQAFLFTGYYNNSMNWIDDVLYIDHHLISAKKTVCGTYKIKEGTLTIADYAFQSCAQLTSVIIPEGVTKIGVLSFSGCSALNSVIIPDSMQIIDSHAYSSCISLDNITLPDTSISIGYGALIDTGYALDDSNWINDELYIGHHLIAVRPSVSGSYEVKEGTLTIAGGAFEGCVNLTHITIPDSARLIGDYTFRHCENLISVELGNNILSIGVSAFAYCDRLTSVSIPNSVVSIGESAFYACYRLTSITIPDGVTQIEAHTFSGSGIGNILLPSSITSIGYGAFFNCYSFTITFNGTVDQWNSISLGGYWKSDENYVVTVICSNGTIKLT